MTTLYCFYNGYNYRRLREREMFIFYHEYIFVYYDNGCPRYKSDYVSYMITEDSMYKSGEIFKDILQGYINLPLLANTITTPMITKRSFFSI